MKTYKYLLLLVTLFLPGVTLAAEMGSALKADVIRAEPYTDAKKIGNFARGDKLEIQSKKGAWLKVKTAKDSGWVRLLSVKRGTSKSSNEAAGVLDVASGRAGTGSGPGSHQDRDHQRAERHPEHEGRPEGRRRSPDRVQSQAAGTGEKTD